jgi:hypothetical protein
LIADEPARSARPFGRPDHRQTLADLTGICARHRYVQHAAP